MSTVSTPTVNKIIKCKEFDQLRTAITAGNMYICTDSLVMYYDETSTTRSVYSYVGVKTVNDLVYNTAGDYGTSYYCWEDNSLWLWLNKWIVLYSDTTYPSAYVFNDIPSQVEPQALDGVYNLNGVLDNNGLLGDGSVVVRDRNRIIKGKFYINDNNDNFVMSSYLGGGIRLLPNGHQDTTGELLLEDEGNSTFRSNLSLLEGEYYVDYSENPEEDDNPYQNDEHKYLVFHEGNLDASAIREVTPEEIYTKLLTLSTLTTPLEFNVSYLDGHDIDDFSLVGHTHTSSDISDFATAVTEQAGTVVRTVANTLAGDGLNLTKDVANMVYTLNADTFTLTLSGGVVGSAKVVSLTDTTITTTVDPDAHTHTSYITRMDDLQEQINDISSIDISLYYTKVETDDLINSVAGTEESTIGKSVIVSSDGTLHATATSATQLSEYRTYTFEGDVIGTFSTNFANDEIITLESNITSSIATAGKALLVNSEGNLPANATSASKLNHNITLSLTGEASGSVLIDTSLETATLSVTLNPGDDILTVDDLVSNGGTIVTLNENNLIDSQYLPIGNSIAYLGMFDPDEGIPDTQDLEEGDFYVASNNGTVVIEDTETGETTEIFLYTNDWLIYLNGTWQRLAFTQDVTSVNGYTGDVELTIDDLGGISSTLIDYTSGDPVPQGYIVTTTETGRISGTTVDSLTDEFSLLTDSSSEIVIDTDTSNNTSTDGTQDLDINLKISETGYEAILDNVAHELVYNGTTLDHTRYLYFESGFTIEVDEDTSIISIDDSFFYNDFIYIDSNNYASNSDYANNIAIRLVSMWSNKDELPFTIIYGYNNLFYEYYINSETSELGQSLSIALATSQVSTSYEIEDNYISFSSISYNSLVIETNETGTISNIYLNEETESSSSTETPMALLINGGSDDSTFIPEESWQPATKEYVDSAVKNSGVTRYVQTIIGDGTTTEFEITHNLDNKYVIVQVRDDSTGSQIYVENTMVDSNTLNIVFSVAPESDSSYQVIVI